MALMFTAMSRQFKNGIMAIIYTLKNEIGVFEQSLEGKDNHTKRQLKAKLLAEAGLPSTFQYKNYTITVTDSPHTRDSLAGGQGEWLEVSVEAVDNNTNQSILVDNPLQWQNPYFKVHDGTYYKETIPVIGEVDVKNLVENPLEAFKEQIGYIVDLVARGKIRGGQS